MATMLEGVGGKALVDLPPVEDLFFAASLTNTLFSLCHWLLLSTLLLLWKWLAFQFCLNRFYIVIINTKIEYIFTFSFKSLSRIIIIYIGILHGTYISDDSSEHVAHAWRKMGLFGEKSHLWLLSILPNAFNRSNNKNTCPSFSE